MESGITRMIYLGIAVVLALIVGSFAMTYINSQKESAGKAMDQVTQMTASLSDSDVKRLQGGSMMGSEVLQTIARLENSENFFVAVKTKAGNQVYYISNQNLDKIPMADEAILLANAKDPKHNDYINPAARFSVSATNGEGLVYNANDVLVGVIFTQNP